MVPDHLDQGIENLPFLFLFRKQLKLSPKDFPNGTRVAIRVLVEKNGAHHLAEFIERLS